MKRVILFVSLLLLTYVNSNAGNTPAGEPSALTADFSASVTSGCAPLVVQFTSTSTNNPGDPIVSYTWNFGDGTIITTPNANPSHTYTTTDPFKSFTVTLTVNSQSGGTHSTSKADYITAYEKPVFSLGNDTAICGSGSLCFILPSYDSYAWSQGTATTPYGCLNYSTGTNILWAEATSGTCTVRDTMIVTGITGLTGKFGYEIINTCGTVDVQFYDSAVSCDPSFPPDYWEWIMDDDWDNGKYGEQNPTYSFTTGGFHKVSYYVQNGLGEIAVKDSTIILPNPTPGPAPVNLGPDKNICMGSSVQLDAGQEPGATYVWSPATGLSNTSVYNPVASPSVATTYTVIKSKCGVDAAPASVTVNVNPPFVVDLGPDQSMCPGGSLTLDAGVTGATYQWSSTYSPAYATMTSKTVIALGAGTYGVTVTKNGCTVNDNIVITAKPAVDPMFTYAQTGFCSTLSVDFTDASIPCSGSITNFVWNFGDGTPVVSGYNPALSHTYSTTGTKHVSLTVTTSGGVSQTYEQDIVVTGGTPPVINLGPAAAICAGSTITLDAGNPGATYSWSPGGQTTQTITVGTAGNYSVTVTKDGCTGTGSKTVTVNTSGLVVNLGPDIERCAIGLPTKLDAGITGASYLWGSNPYVPTVANKTTKTVQTLTAGKFWVTVTKDGCSVTDTIMVIEKPKVSPKFTFTQTGSCSPIKVNFTDATEACSSISNYEWNFGDASPVLSGYNPNPEHDYDQPGPYKVTLTVSISGESKTYEENIIVTGTGIPVNLGNDTTICAGSTIALDAGDHPGATYEWAPNGETTRSITVDKADTYIVTVTKDGCRTIDAINVTVVPALTVNLGNDTTICPGNPVILDAGNPGATYLWSTGETTRSISATNAGTYSVTVNKGTCSGSGSMQVNINTTLPVSLGNDTTICAGSSITLDAGYPGATYAWNTSATSQAITVTDAGIYKVTVTNSGCAGKAEIEVSLMAAATPVNLGNDTTICFGNAVVLDAGNPGATYVWSTGETAQIIYPMVSGTYSVDVTRCAVTVRDEIYLAITNLPLPSVTQSGNELIASEADTYQWYKNGMLIPGAIAKKYKPRGYGKYKVVVTSTSTGCSGESGAYFFVPEGHTYIGDIKVKISPNPGNGLAKLIFSKIPPKPIKVTVYDRVGRRILVTTMINTVNDINLVAYAKGEYFVECVLDDKRIIIPLITQ
ncbi:PKD domain-containing protein [Agriterribacter sp.]|uniref:PKD domain-containing protein n=1 Tax=Agriterribacter sp. TaxID=2821509 RepID=UPI002CC0816A|nr:PKD domain-containing protein [Agriterribacter sp.]HTN07385.1 PKD domain-containing protein [Agriterribacter sp.]